MKWHKNLITIVICITILAIFPIALGAQVASVVDVRIKISVCGNGIKEGGEECDQSDLDNENCSTQGYSSGTLACDYSCFFDYDDCVMVSPTPTPTPSPTPTSTPTPTPTPSPTSTPASTTTATSTPSPTSISTTSPTVLPTVSLTPRTTTTPRATSTALPRASVSPSFNSQLFESEIDQGKTGQVAELPWQLTLFDLDNSGKIENHELFPAAKNWLEEKKKVDSPNFASIGKEKENLVCDLNKDNICNIIDFSLLLFFVER